MSLFLSLALSSLPFLSEPVTNNAVAKVTTQNQTYFLSFMGLSKDKEYNDVHSKVWVLKIGDEQWQQKASVPSSLPIKGRLASTAVGLGEHAYIFGGYTRYQSRCVFQSA